MPDAEVIKRSVTRDDYPKDPRSGILHFFMPQWGLGSAPDLPPFWSPQRDAMLMGTLYRESMWESAVTIAIGKKATQDWKVDSDVSLRAQRAQQLFLEMDSGRGWVSGLQRHLQSYLLAGNGGHIEIVRATSASGSRILGLVPLDPLRCLRTGDADIPLLYRDRRGALHEMRDCDVLNVTDMPDPQELWYGVGHCAAERAYYKIMTMEGLERFISEKITGRRPLAIHIINGLSIDQIQTAISTAQEDAQRKGLTNFMGAAIATVIDPTAPPGLVTIPLAELPEGFQAVEERREAKLLYADALGIDPQELDPALASRGAMGTGAQSVVLDEKAKGKGLWVWDKSFSFCVNEYCLDDRTTFTFQENDLRDQKQRADILATESGALKVLIDGGVMTGTQAMNYLVDHEEMPKEYLPADVTPDGDLTDGEKPQTGEEQAAPPEGGEVVPVAPVLPKVPSPAGKAVNPKRLIAREMDAARKLADAARVKKKQVATDELPGPLGYLIDQFTADLQALTDDLQAGRILLPYWEQQFGVLLARYQCAGMMTGANTDTLTDPMITKISDYLTEQFGFLDGFKVEIANNPDEWQAGWNQRALSYAGSIKTPYWQGAVKMLPLPAMPGDGTTQCLGNCKCAWDVQELDADAGDYDATWVYGETEDHCQTCKVRASQWNPIRIRGGMLQI